LNGIQEVGGSTPPGSTSLHWLHELRPGKLLKIPPQAQKNVRRLAVPPARRTCYVGHSIEWERVMRERWIGAILSAAIGSALSLAASGQLSAQQSGVPATQPDPNLNTEDQLAPSQMKQAMPGQVSEPGSAPAKPAHPAHTAAVKPFSPSARVVACSGIFSKDSSHLRLAMTYDGKNVAFTDVDADGGAKVQATVLYPNDPKQRLEVWWSNPAARTGTYLIVINNKSTWTAPGGMKLGLTLAQLEKLNHKPFKLKGFDKNGVASVSDWDDGTLANLPGGCKSGLSLIADPKAAPDAVSAITADQEYSSSDPAVRAVKPTVSEVLIGY
jgi:hypothetical protein